jgi:hypothetical protein
MRLDPPVAGGAFAGGVAGAGAGAALGAGATLGAGGAAGVSDFPKPKSPDIEFNKPFDPLDISVLS